MRICFLSPWPDPTTVFLTRVRCVFGDAQAVQDAGTSKRDTARLAELQGRGGVPVDEGLLDGGLVRDGWLSRTSDRPRDAVDKSRSARLPLASGGEDRPGGDEGQRTAARLDHTPQPVRLRPGSIPRMQIACCAAHGPVDSPAPRPRLGRDWAPQPVFHLAGPAAAC